MKKIDNDMIKKWVEILLKDNPLLVDKLKKQLGDNKNDIKEIYIEVVKFLSLVEISKVRLSPSLLVDLGWHEFILFTKTYTSFCNEKFGRYIHHTPDKKGSSDNSNYLKTINYYIKYFGKPPKHIWGDVSENEWKNSQCGSCNSN